MTARWIQNGCQSLEKGQPQDFWALKTFTKGNMQMKKFHKNGKKSIISLLPPIPQDHLDLNGFGKKLETSWG